MPDNPRRGLFQAIATQQQSLEEARDAVSKLARRSADDRDVIRRQSVQIRTLATGMQALLQALGPEASRLVTTAMTRTADVQNPAQPIPEPPAQPAAFTTQDAKTPEAMESPNNPGLVPGSTNDVAADATTTVYQPGADVDTSALHNLIDVTTPVDGTQGPQPLSDVRTLTDVRVGDPNNQSQAFPLRGDFAQRQVTNPSGRQASRQAPSDGRRSFAALRLVEARAATGDTEAAEGQKYALAAQIEKSAASTEEIEREIATLETVAKRMPAVEGRPVTASSRSLVPRAAAGEPRSVPSMQSTAAHSGAPVTGGLVDDADLFLE
jgi:hypothetical protein